MPESFSSTTSGPAFSSGQGLGNTVDVSVASFVRNCLLRFVWITIMNIMND